MKVLVFNNYKIYIYPDDCQQHHLPHCHIRIKNTDVSVLALPMLNVIVGQSIEKRLRFFLEENIDYLCNKWDELNPDC